VYVFLEIPEDCIQRVRLGGHAIPDQYVIRRYYRSKANFWHIYRPLAVRWFIYHNSATDAPSQIAFGTRNSGVFENENLSTLFLRDIDQ
jgi:predicted ABC-type ATPase